MANVTNLKNGSSGSDVKKLQEALIAAGYDVGKTGADGVLGKNTEAAIKKYQKDNGLTVDGIAGKNTQGLLYGSGSNKGNAGGGTNTGGNTNAGGNAVNDVPIVKDNVSANEVAGTPKVEEPTLVTAPAEFTYGDFSYATFDPTDNEQINQANALLNQNLANKPGSYKPVWMDEADAYLSKYQNRDPFSYDFNSDALYQQYKDQYIQQGQLAMMDTMGQAAAMTGGYGNSYAQTVGQQAYNQQLNQLNEIMPELYNMAYNRYNQEGQDLLNMYDLYMNRENMSYNQYQDSLSNWYQENALLTDNYNTAYDRAYNNYLLGYNTALGQYETGRSEAFSNYQNAVNQAFTSSENEKDRAYSSSEKEKDRAFTESQNEIDRNFSASENEKDRAESQKTNAKKDLINLITGTGYKPTDDELAAAGMTRAQADSYAKAYEQSTSSSSTNTNKTTETKYTVLDYEEQVKWEKSFEKAESIGDVDRIADKMEQAGVDPQVVANWRDYYAEKFEDEEVEVKVPIGANGTAGGGGAGGTWFYGVR